MWFFTSEGFYSAVLERNGPNKGKLAVRAREPGALELLRDRYMAQLGETSITPATIRADYRYRAWIDHDGFAEGLANIGRAIDYSNFKSEAAAKRGFGRFEKALHEVWSVMGRLQPGGPYGWGGKGYPAIPAGEKPKGKRARKKKAVLQGALPLADVEELTECEDCGANLEPEDGEVFGGRWLCKDVSACSNRMHEKGRR